MELSATRIVRILMLAWILTISVSCSSTFSDARSSLPTSAGQFRLGETYETTGPTRIADYGDGPLVFLSNLSVVNQRFVIYMNDKFRLRVTEVRLDWAFAVGGWRVDVTLTAVDGRLAGKKFSGQSGPVQRTPGGVLFWLPDPRFLRSVTR